MSDIVVLLSILWVHLLAVMSPWPDFVMAVKNSLTYGRRAGIRTAVWFSLWIAVHISYCVLWLALVISQSIIVFSVIKYAGAVYLIWIWLKALFSNKKTVVATKDLVVYEHITPVQALKQWFLTNVLNPKATLFFLWLFTMMIGPETSTSVLFIASVMMIINTGLRFSLVSVLCTHRTLRSKIQQWQAFIEKVLWWALVFLGGLIIIRE